MTSPEDRCHEGPGRRRSAASATRSRDHEARRRRVRRGRPTTGRRRPRRLRAALAGHAPWLPISWIAADDERDRRALPNCEPSTTRSRALTGGLRRDHRPPPTIGRNASEETCHVNPPAGITSRYAPRSRREPVAGVRLAHAPDRPGPSVALARGAAGGLRARLVPHGRGGRPRGGGPVRGGPARGDAHPRLPRARLGAPRPSGAGRTRSALTRPSTRWWPPARRTGRGCGSRRAWARPTARCTALGLAHSVEAWSGERLAGGLFGVALGGLFTSESMFHREPDAGNAALVGAAAPPGRARASRSGTSR